MIFPTILLLSLPILASAVPQRQPVSVNPHLALAGSLLNTRDVADDCPTCTSFATTVAGCLQLTTLEETSTCLCTASVFNDLNTCIECPAVTSRDQYSDLVSSSSQLTTSCAELGVTGLPVVDPLPAATSSPETDSAIASDSPSTAAVGEGSAPTTAATTAAGVATTHAGTTTTKALVSPTSKTSTKATSASSSASASVAASSGFKSFGGSSIFVGAAGVVGVWAALI